MEKIIRKKWEWEYKEKIDSRLSESDIKKAINHKVANIIIELEHNPINYVIDDKKAQNFGNQQL